MNHCVRSLKEALLTRVTWQVSWKTWDTQIMYFENEFTAQSRLIQTKYLVHSRFTPHSDVFQAQQKAFSRQNQAMFDPVPSLPPLNTRLESI